MDQEIRDLEIIHQQVQRKKEKMAPLADLQKRIDEATEEVRHEQYSVTHFHNLRQSIGAHLRCTHFHNLRQSINLRHAEIMEPGAALQPLDTNQDTLSLSERPEAKRERPPVQHFRRRSWTRRSET